MRILLLLISCFSFSAFCQIKQIANAELTVGSGMFFQAEMNNGTNTITVTVKGPADRYLAFGFGSGAGMSSGDVLMYSNATGSNAVADHFLAGGTTPPTDAQQDWTIQSNTVASNVRTIVASRNLNTGDANDYQFNFSDASVPLFWAKGASASTSVSYHGGSNRALGIVRTWTVPDVTAPSLSSTNPTNNAIGASLTANLTATFSENIAFAGGGIELRDGSNNLVETFVNGSTATISGTTLTLNPTSNLTVNTVYQVIIPSTSIADLAGNPYAGLTAGNWTFNTNDIIAPTLNTLSPANNSNITNLSVNIIGGFSENIQFGSGSIELRNGSNVTIETFVAGSTASIVGSTLTLNPTANFTVNQTYKVVIAPSAILDITGNAYAGTTNNWTFTTNDLIAPTLSSLSPADNSIGVATNSTLSIAFSEPIEWGTGAIQLRDASNVLIESFTSASANAVITSNILEMTPTNPLLANTSYYITISNQAISDTSGNFYAGISSTTGWNFSAISTNAPILIPTSFTPSDNAVNVVTSPTLSVSFDQNVLFNSGSFIEIWNVQSNTIAEQILAASITVSGNTLTFSPTATLNENTEYAVQIPANAIQNSSNQFFGGIQDLTTWNFFIGDFTAPTMVTLSPVDNATQISINSVVSIEFSEPVAIGTGSILIMDNTNSSVHSVYDVNSNFASISISGNQMSITPATPFLGSTDYAILIENDAIVDTSVNANAFIGFGLPTQWNFTTESTQGIEEWSTDQFSWNQNQFIVLENTDELTVTDLTGKLIASTQGTSLELNQLPQGVYMVRWNNKMARIFKQ